MSGSACHNFDRDWGDCGRCGPCLAKAANQSLNDRFRRIEDALADLARKIEERP